MIKTKEIKLSIAIIFETESLAGKPSETSIEVGVMDKDGNNITDKLDSHVLDALANEVGKAMSND